LLANTERASNVQQQLANGAYMTGIAPSVPRRAESEVVQNDARQRTENQRAKRATKPFVMITPNIARIAVR
jgi:hypothetical protein